MTAGRAGVPPTDLGAVVAAVFDDTCGNLIQIVSPAKEHAAGA